jgi:uncharacterized phiE125 gp8 family phage protein
VAVSGSIATLVRVEGPTEEPLTLADARLHLRLDTADEDTYVSALITAARQWVELKTSRTMLTTSWLLSLPEWPTGPIYLPNGPLQGITSVQYLDDNGETQDLDDGLFVVDQYNVPPRLVLAPSQSWPSITSQAGAIQVQYDSGWPDAESVPGPLKQAMLLLIGHWYEHREAALENPILTLVPLGVEALIAPYRLITFY